MKRSCLPPCIAMHLSPNFLSISHNSYHYRSFYFICTVRMYSPIYSNSGIAWLQTCVLVGNNERLRVGCWLVLVLDISVLGSFLNHSRFVLSLGVRLHLPSLLFNNFFCESFEPGNWKWTNCLEKDFCQFLSDFVIRISESCVDKTRKGWKCKREPSPSSVYLSLLR